MLLLQQLLILSSLSGSALPLSRDPDCNAIQKSPCVCDRLWGTWCVSYAPRKTVPVTGTPAEQTPKTLSSSHRISFSQTLCTFPSSFSLLLSSDPMHGLFCAECSLSQESGRRGCAGPVVLFLRLAFLRAEQRATQAEKRYMAECELISLETGRPEPQS